MLGPVTWVPFQGTFLPEGALTWAPSHYGTLPSGGPLTLAPFHLGAFLVGWASYLGIFSPGHLSPGHPSHGPTLALNLNSPVPMGTILCLLKLRFLLCKVGLMLPFDSVRKIHPTPFQGARCP